MATTPARLGAARYSSSDGGGSCRGISSDRSSSGGGSCRGLSSDRNSSGVDSVDGGNGVPFSRPARRRPLRATFFRAAVFRTAVLRVPILRPAVFLRVTAFRAVVFRAAVLRAAVFRPTVLRGTVLRVALLRAAVLRPAVVRAAVWRVALLCTVDFRPAVLRAATLRGAVFRAPVLRGRPGLRLLGMTPSLCSSVWRGDRYLIARYEYRRRRVIGRYQAPSHAVYSTDAPAGRSFLECAVPDRPGTARTFDGPTRVVSSWSEWPEVVKLALGSEASLSGRLRETCERASGRS
jgi:hypothetical protein